MIVLSVALATGRTWAQALTPAADRESPLFYKPLTYGSESQFNPASSFVNQGLDAVQIPESFDDNHFGSRAEQVWKHLTDPFTAIRAEGGYRHFVNRQLFPVGPDFSDSIEMIPNYGLHVIGGGMTYRKNVEWFQWHGYPYPRVLAISAAMGAEFINEVIEKKSTADDDEVADFYLMRPLGIALFSWDTFARFAAEQLRMAEWPYQPMFSPRHQEFMNVGENWIIRPPLFGTERHKPFLYFGLTTLLGASHQLSDTDSFSWGVGPAIERADPDDVEYRWSGGLFYDRHGSLLASLLVNGTENLAVRLNVYPGAVVQSRWFPGIFVGVSDDSDVSVGLTWRVFPIGLSDSTR